MGVFNFLKKIGTASLKGLEKESRIKNEWRPRLRGVSDGQLLKDVKRCGSLGKMSAIVDELNARGYHCNEGVWRKR